MLPLGSFVAFHIRGYGSVECTQPHDLAAGFIRVYVLLVQPPTMVPR